MQVCCTDSESWFDRFADRPRDSSVEVTRAERPDRLRQVERTSEGVDQSTADKVTSEREPKSEEPIVLLESALDEMDDAIVFNAAVPRASHTVVTVDGLEKPQVPVALGRYLVGAIAGAVDIDARLSTILLARGADRRAETMTTVTSIVGVTNVFETEAETTFRDTRRNAWIGEGVGHALLMLTARRETSCVDGIVLTLSDIHPSPTRQGLDSVSTYISDEVLAVAIGENKTTCSDGSRQLSEAAGIFADVDRGVYGPDLRASLAGFRRALPDSLASQVSDSIWSERGCYLPMIVFQDDFDVMGNRPALARLAPPAERRRVIIAQLVDFHAFFDAVADAMRAAVSEVVV